MLFWNLYSNVKVSCMPIACLLFWLFTANVFFFQLLGCGICMQIPFLIGVQNGHISGYKHGQILLEMYFWSLISKISGHFYDNCFFYFVSFCFLMHFLGLGCGIRMHIPTLIVVKEDRLLAERWSHFAKK